MSNSNLKKLVTLNELEILFIDFGDIQPLQNYVCFFRLRIGTFRLCLFFLSLSAFVFERKQGTNQFVVDNCSLLKSVCYIIVLSSKFVKQFADDVTQTRQGTGIPSAIAGRRRRGNIAQITRPFAFLITKHNSAALAWGHENIERTGPILVNFTNTVFWAFKNTPFFKSALIGN